MGGKSQWFLRICKLLTQPIFVIVLKMLTYIDITEIGDGWNVCKIKFFQLFKMTMGKIKKFLTFHSHLFIIGFSREV